MSENAIERAVTRRGLLVLGLAGGTGLLVGCGSAARSDAGWTFVDDRMHAVRLKRRPTRIVAYTTAAAALYDWGVTPVGVFGVDPHEDPSLAGFPWGNVQIVGSSYGEVDPGALHSLNAQLIVSRWYPPPDDAPVFGFKDRKQERAIGAQVPIVGINGHVIATRQIDRFRDLARALAVNTTSARIGRARAEFVTAATNLSRVARRKSNLRIISVSGDQNARSGVLPLRDAKGIPAFARLPAVRANQIAAWQGDPPPSYQRYTRTINDLAKAIAGWHEVM
jgi:iron complex transport system substrate-binding protein